MYDDNEEKNKIKKMLSIEQVFDYVSDLGGDPQMRNGYFISQTICHNPIGEGSYKLFYYENTKLFKCFTECEGGAFDIFDLTTKVKQIRGIKQESKDENGEIILREWTLYDSIGYVAHYFNIPLNRKEKGFTGFYLSIADWQVLERYDIDHQEEEQKIELKFYDESILKYFSLPHIVPWEEEGISYQVMKECSIAYDPVALGVIIPHFDMNGNLVGIRERTLIREEEKNGKYKPAFLRNQLYNHPLGFNLYNLNNSKDNIRNIGKVIIYESEKSCLLHRSYFGGDGDISVAVCGSSLTNAQFKILLSFGINEMIIAFDKQWQKNGDEEFQRWTKKLQSINDKYRKYVLISFMFDKNGILGYKDSPIDCGSEKFIQLFKERIIL